MTLQGSRLHRREAIPVDSKEKVCRRPFLGVMRELDEVKSNHSRGTIKSRAWTSHSCYSAAFRWGALGEVLMQVVMTTIGTLPVESGTRVDGK